jgi:GrpB-like predicted nucleotidyltransferase (UPF0157 family)
MTAAFFRVEVVPHDRNWRSTFEIESRQISLALSDNSIALHHIGSTAIPNIYAKPIIDILLEVKDIGKLDDRTCQLEALGYEAMGKFGIPGRRYFRKNDGTGRRTHQIHAFEVGSPHLERHLAFRDYLTAHPEEAQKYSELKRELAKQHPNDIIGYMDGKDGFIKEMEQKALAWRSSLANRSERSDIN